MFVAAAIVFPVVLLLAALGMERVERRLNRPSTVLSIRAEPVEVFLDQDPAATPQRLSTGQEGAA